MLTDCYTREFIAAHLVPAGEWRPFPRACDREAWATWMAQPGNDRRAEALIAVSSELLGSPWPVLTARGFMDYVRDGDRDRFQRPYFERRRRTGLAAVAECLEGRGRFVDEVVEGVWLICDEATWCVPAHIWPEWDGALPKLERPIVDLFAAETAFVLSEACWL